MSDILASLFMALVGMGVVFAFLSLLVGLLCLIGLAASGWEDGEAEAHPEDIVAIAAGVAAYLAHHRKPNGDL